MTLVVNVVVGFVIGLFLGMLGGGGSILTVPALVYLAGQTPQAAVTTSLAIVGANSALGALFHTRRGTLNWRVALLFGMAGMVAAYLAGGLSRQFDPRMLLILFACLMLVVGLLMIFRREPGQTPNLPARLPTILLAGLAVGFLTGLLGVGGGFLIVPALVLLVGLPIQSAIGTSLAVIALNSLAGLMAHWGGSLDLGLIASFVVAGLAGTRAGTAFAHRLPSRHLRRAFGVFVVLLGLYLLYDNLPRLL